MPPPPEIWAATPALPARCPRRLAGSVDRLGCQSGWRPRAKGLGHPDGQALAAVFGCRRKRRWRWRGGRRPRPSTARAAIRRLVGYAALAGRAPRRCRSYLPARDSPTTGAGNWRFIVGLPLVGSERATLQPYLRPARMHRTLPSINAP